MKQKKKPAAERQRLRLQVIDCLDRCRRCQYGDGAISAFCEICPTYQEMRGLCEALCPDRSHEYAPANVRAVLEKGPAMGKNDLEYLIAARVPNRMIADRMQVGVRELNRIIENLGI